MGARPDDDIESALPICLPKRPPLLKRWLGPEGGTVQTELDSIILRNAIRHLTLRLKDQERRAMDARLGVAGKIYR